MWDTKLKHLGSPVKTSEGTLNVRVVLERPIIKAGPGQRAGSRTELWKMQAIFGSRRDCSCQQLGPEG